MWAKRQAAMLSGAKRKLSDSHDEAAKKARSAEMRALLEHIISEKGAKQKNCSKAGEADDRDPENCSKDGYLMAKRLEPDPKVEFTEPNVYQSYNVCTEWGAYELECVQVKSLIKNSVDKFHKLDRLMLNGRKAMEVYVDELCVIDEKTKRGINFESFGKELAGDTHWYYAKEDLGSIFLRYENDKKKLDLSDRGYLYVVLVCAKKGTGEGIKLLQMAEAFAKQLGLEHIVLAALPHVITYYYNKMGYKFVSVTDGKVIDVVKWIVDGKLTL